jgi:mRNA deadenylase 3'-5' endonuclease subunit Ccr4
MIRATTYNVLAQSMMKYVKGEPEHLLWSHRCELISAELRPRIAAHHIIALQEVDQTMDEVLSRLFQDTSYTILKSFYSSPDRARFGAWLCVPSEDYDILESSSTRLGNLIPIPADVTNSQRPLQQRQDSEQIDVFADATRRSNEMIYARLRRKSSVNSFVVATYHMPCAFWWPGVMTLHLAALKAELWRIQQSCGYSQPAFVLLLGDFNITPESSLMEFLLHSQLSSEILPLPDWRPPQNMLQFSRLAPEGNEDWFTCWNGSFKGSLDHAFLAGTSVEACSDDSRQSPEQEAAKPTQALVQSPVLKVFITPPDQSIPDQFRGSDHVPVSVELDFGDAI